ncbi:MAG TPA: type VI secretion system baseplate subunit TssK, partial [Polyangiaceae bacterium]|nr:type VI secretion system baseplate subunit TssK [Polyangiaceae bacterium]
VSQHHFQQQDRYHEALLRDRLQGVAHYDFGVTELEIDERAFSAGQFRVKKFSAIWPDGASVSCGDGTPEPPPPPRTLPGDAVRIEVLLGLSQETDTSGLVVGDSESSVARRFTREIRNVVDTNTGGSPQEVEWARPNLRVFFGNERREGYTVIRVAELLRQENGQFQVLDTRLPPVLHLRAAPFLANGIERVLANIVARAQQLSGERRQRQAGGNVDFHASETRKFWLLHTLNGSIPRLTHLLATPRVHPEEAYVTLAELAGMLCSFSTGIEPTDIPKFNYLELGEVFEALFAIVLRLLPGGIEQPYVEIPLEHRPDGMFIGRIPDPKLVADEFFVAVKSNMADALVRERVPAVLKMAGWNQIFDVVKQARHGVRVEIEWNPVGALPMKPGMCLFRVRRENSYWDEIAKSQTVALYLPVDSDWSNTTLSLYAIEPSKLR